MSTLMLDTDDSRRATLATLRAVPIPAATPTYTPLPHEEAINRLLTPSLAQLPVVLKSARYGLARQGRRMFAVLEFRSKGDTDWGFAWGVRNSYDRSVSYGIAGGSSVFVCSNLCFSGNAITVFRKHTSRIMHDVDGMINGAVSTGWGHYREMDADLNSFRGVRVSDDDAHAALGVALGRGWLRSGELLKAAKYWRQAPHPEHRTGDLFALYQSINHALKGAQPERAIGAHTSLHAHILEMREGQKGWSLASPAAAVAEAAARAAADGSDPILEGVSPSAIYVGG